MLPAEGALLEAIHIERSFGARRVLRGVDLSLAPGEVLAVLGPNGAGKTTLLRVLAGLIRPNVGEVRVQGRAFGRDDPETRRAIGFLSHHSLLYDDLSLIENLTFAARLYGLPRPDGLARRRLEEAGLGDRLDERPRGLSRGLQQRAAIARTLLHQPAILLLDEPFTGLDAVASGHLRAQLGAEAARGTALLLVTHHSPEVWDLATRVAVLASGRWLLDTPRPDDAAAFAVRYQELVRA
jgi:heme exporter protein A